MGVKVPSGQPPKQKAVSGFVEALQLIFHVETSTAFEG
jgi:hypothetical protein